MKARSIVIIGAGIAGLSAGVYARINGYTTHVFEMHDKPGGVCTAWKRKGYTIDGCIHHLAGSGPQSPLYKVWEELGVFQSCEMLFHDELVRVEAPDGKSFAVYTDIDRLEHHMRELSPEDARAIDEYTAAARLFSRMDLLAFPLYRPWEAAVKALPMAGAFMKWARITLEQYAARFKDPFLRMAFPTVQYDFRNIPMLVHLNFLAGCSNRTLGWPMGGSMALAQAIEGRYRELGGQISYRSKVIEILVEDDCAVGVRLADGTEHRSDIVISGCDGHSTVFDMLSGRYLDDRLKAYYAAAPDYQDMTVQVSLGVNRDMSREPHALIYFLERPVTIMGKAHDSLDVEVFNFDPSLAPPGKSVMKVMLGSSYAYWRELAGDRSRYEAKKHEIAETVIAELNKRFPGLSGQIDMVDVATPMTIERYTGNWHGLQAWFPPGAGLGAMIKGFSRALPGLRNFYMAGQWAEAMIGISTASISGRKTIQALCRHDGKGFITDDAGADLA